MNDSLTAVTGIQVGHWTNAEAQTGCTVILCPPEGAVASGLAMGGAPGTREMALLAPEKTVDRIHGLCLSGGSAFGLAAAQGLVDWLEQQGRGFETPFARIPIVPAAVIYDLGTGASSIRPDASSGFKAASAASSAPVEQGRIGVGAGATVGKYLGFEKAALSGLGSAALKLGPVTLAALAVSNAVGDIYDPETGRRLAGARGGEGALEHVKKALYGVNTTLVAVATDAKLSKAEARALAQSAHIGIAQVTRPSHTPMDGDTAFVLSTGLYELPLASIAAATQEVVARALMKGVRAAQAVA